MNLYNFQVDNCIFLYLKKKPTTTTTTKNKCNFFTLTKVYNTIKTLVHTYNHIPISSKHTLETIYLMYLQIRILLEVLFDLLTSVILNLNIKAVCSYFICHHCTTTSHIDRIARNV